MRLLEVLPSLGAARVGTGQSGGGVSLPGRVFLDPLIAVRMGSWHRGITGFRQGLAGARFDREFLGHLALGEIVAEGKGADEGENGDDADGPGYEMVTGHGFPPNLGARSDVSDVRGGIVGTRTGSQDDGFGIPDVGVGLVFRVHSTLHGDHTRKVCAL